MRLQDPLQSVRGRQTTAEGGVVLSLLAVLVIATFAPASRDLAPSASGTIPADDAGPAPLAASLASVAAADDPSEPEVSTVVIDREWDAGRRDAGPRDGNAVISWWDDERWAEREAEQERWRREWVAEARRNPGRVPLELWPKIVAWAPDDRSIYRSARAVLGDERLLRRYAARIRGGERSFSGRDGMRGDGDSVIRTDGDRMASRLRRWARDALQQIRDRAARTRTNRPPG